MPVTTNTPRNPSVSSTANRPQAAASCAMQETAEQAIRPLKDLRQYASCYVRQNPESAALWCFGLGFLLAWRLKG